MTLPSQTRRDFLKTLAGAAGLAGTGALLGACGGSTSSPSSTQGSTQQGQPKRGGTLTVGVTGGSTSDVVDGFNLYVNTDDARVTALNEPLIIYSPQGGSFELRLAEEFSANADGTEYVVRLKPDLTFHNGKPITAEDVIFSFQYLLNPKAPTVGSPAVFAVDPHGFTKLDERTVRIKMLTPQFILPELLTYNAYPIVPTDYNPKKPIGAGPFKLESFVPGQRSTMSRFDDYYLSPMPYLDALDIVDFPDVTSQTNALIGGQINAASALPWVATRQLASNSAVKVYNVPTGQYLEYVMRLDTGPFKDVRVRQAMRLIVDRHQFIETIYNGNAELGNDLFGRSDPDYDSAISQRAQDLDQAKFLLKQAGALDYAFTMISGPWTAGILEGAELIAQQASTAGVNIRVDNTPIGQFVAQDYTKVPFACGYWYDTPYVAQCVVTMTPTAGQNETNWHNANWDALWNSLNRSSDAAMRKDIIHEMQTIEWNEGGLIIPAFFNEVDGVAANVNGFDVSHEVGPLRNWHFEYAWLS